MIDNILGIQQEINYFNLLVIDCKEHIKKLEKKVYKPGICEYANEMIIELRKMRKKYEEKCLKYQILLHDLKFCMIFS